MYLKCVRTYPKWNYGHGQKTLFNGRIYRTTPAWDNYYGITPEKDDLFVILNNIEVLIEMNKGTKIEKLDL